MRRCQWEWINNSFFSTYSSIVKAAMEGMEAVLCTVTWKYWISSKYKCTPFTWTVSSLINKFVYIYMYELITLLIKLLNLFKWIVSSLINKFEYVLINYSLFIKLLNLCVVRAKWAEGLRGPYWDWKKYSPCCYKNCQPSCVCFSQYFCTQQFVCCTLGTIIFILDRSRGLTLQSFYYLKSELKC